MVNDHEPLITNAIAHLAGAIVFGIFLVLALRARQEGALVRTGYQLIGWSGVDLECRILREPHFAFQHGSLGHEAASFSSLSLLPAVLLHLSLRGKFRTSSCRNLRLDEFGKLCERLLPATHLHKWALWVITVGFGALTLISAAEVLLHGGKETRGKTSQLLASMCLLLFAVTFSHFGVGHPPRPWSKELLVHHAGIPVALLILLQDYRFVFLDAFVRFLANVFLAALPHSGNPPCCRLCSESVVASSERYLAVSLCGL
jgi:hypothetical protein